MLRACSKLVLERNFLFKWFYRQEKIWLESLDKQVISRDNMSNTDILFVIFEYNHLLNLNLTN